MTGLVVTKLDGSARGGMVVALAEEFGLPVHAVGVGEQADDLRPFDAGEFAKGFGGRGGGVAAPARPPTMPPRPASLDVLMDTDSRPSTCGAYIGG